MATRQYNERRRADYAWQRVTDVKARDATAAKEYKALACSATADIQSCGLGQTLAFWRAKANTSTAHDVLYQHVSKWVGPEVSTGWRDADLLQKIIDANTSGDLYRYATAEAIAVLVWLKRFAEAELSD